MGSVTFAAPLYRCDAYIYVQYPETFNGRLLCASKPACVLLYYYLLCFFSVCARECAIHVRNAASIPNTTGVKKTWQRPLLQSLILHEMRYRKQVREYVYHVTYISPLNLAGKLHGYIDQARSISPAKFNGETELMFWPQDSNWPLNLARKLN